MEFKRLTLHNLSSAYDYESKNLTQDKAEEVYKRLSELEDKIENGTLVEFPFYKTETFNGRVNYIVFFISKLSGFVDNYICQSEEQAKGKIKELRGIRR